MMNKKQIVGFCGLILMMCFGLLLALGCKEDKEVEPVTQEIVAVEETQEEIVEEEIDIQESEEAVVEEVVEPEVVEEVIVEEPTEVEETEAVETYTFDQDEIHYYLTTTLTDSEYDDYFNEAMGSSWTIKSRAIEFDAHILEQTKSEKYKTRCELMLGSGDYDNGNFTGPYIKTRDIAYTDLEGAHEGSNVRVTATIEEYDVEHGWLKITIRDIEVR